MNKRTRSTAVLRSVLSVLPSGGRPSHDPPFVSSGPGPDGEYPAPLNQRVLCIHLIPSSSLPLHLQLLITHTLSFPSTGRYHPSLLHSFLLSSFLPSSTRKRFFGLQSGKGPPLRCVLRCAPTEQPNERREANAR